MGAHEVNTALDDNRPFWFNLVGDMNVLQAGHQELISAIARHDAAHRQVAKSIFMFVLPWVLELGLFGLGFFIASNGYPFGAFIVFVPMILIWWFVKRPPFNGFGTGVIKLASRDVEDLRLLIESEADSFCVAMFSWLPYKWEVDELNQSLRGRPMEVFILGDGIGNLRVNIDTLEMRYFDGGAYVEFDESLARLIAKESSRKADSLIDDIARLRECSEALSARLITP